MDNLSEIIKRRSAPGILILDMDKRLLYSNADALDLMPILKETATNECMVNSYVPKEIIEVCKRLGESSAGTADMADIEQSSVVPGSEGGNPCSLRAFYIGQHGKCGKPTHIMVLVERVVVKHKPDFVIAKKEFNLSDRELEVLGCVCHGFANKTISDKLFISEFTVKDHIKKIMRKMNVGSRSEMIALLK
jgi:DNA-binding CsgD family transcriptional regulator